MGRLSANQALASAVVARLRASGVRTFCLCPGGRNAPFVEVLETLAADAVELLSFFDERSAGFFALGRARRDRAPVAVVTTSGTAAAELLPAMVEAHYSVVPLVAVTADRPRSYRRSGAPQSIEQVGLFGSYAAPSIDLEEVGEAGEWALGCGPAHVNVCFSEPLLAGWQTDDGPADATIAGQPAGLAPPPAGDRKGRVSASTTPQDVAGFMADASRPLVIAGGLDGADDRGETLAFCRALGAPVIAEASSGLRTALGPLLLESGDAAVQRGIDEGSFDSVVRVGDVPSFRVWRDLDVSLSLPVLSLSRKPWPGLTRGIHVEAARGCRLIPPALAARPTAAQTSLFAWDRRVAAATHRLMGRYPRSEPALIHRLSETIPSGSFVYLGNSLPIREWNHFATRDDRGFGFGENRGANGIDGQVASFLGWARAGVENWAVVGDLTALYDLSAPWALRHLAGVSVRVVVINNGGGRIFQRMFANERFQNQHDTRFAAWAAMWGIEHHTDIAVPSGPAAILELGPDQEQTEAFWTTLGREVSA